MPDMPFSDVPSSIAAGLLETQAGIVSVVQLSASGVSIELAKKRAVAGRWQRIHRGVFAVFSGPVNRPAQVWAALLHAARERRPATSPRRSSMPCASAWTNGST